MQAVVETLTEHGVESETVEEDGYVLVQVPCGKDDDRDCHELIVDIEAWLAEKGLPFVAQEVDGRIVIRPPAS
ncbi:MAG TPA: hypothetical protein VGW30_04645 [Gaiellaceae bacterium]|nr:hypothetical protein [Gaiellaceae bacterium]